MRDSCATGMNIEAHLYAGLDHGGALNGALKDSVPFVRKAMAGGPIASRCAPAAE